jgi:cobalt/nickel transport system permease protein
MLTIFSNIHPSRSFVDRIDPRVRVGTACVFAIFVALSTQFSALGLSLGIAFVLVFLAGILHRSTLQRVIGLNGFMLVLLMLLPLSMPGTPMLRLGILSWSLEGMEKTFLIALKANTIMLAFAALIATIEPIRLGGALDKLGCPEKLTHLLFFVVRYVELIHKEYLRLVNAIRLRCFHPGFNRHTFRTYGYLVGMLLVKSIDRSERILEAMKCRGFRNRFYTLTTFQLTMGDVSFIGIWSGILLVLGYIEWT